jgi:N-alpha-acetyltransferase 35, NatC auxiliary subunit
MGWHVGNALAQTVFTLLYIHNLEDFNPDLLPAEQSSQRDPRRPRELVTVVLRAFVLGLLKCCDLGWRELSQGGVLDVRLQFHLLNHVLMASLSL